MADLLSDGDGANEDLLALADDDGCSEESDSENGDDVRFDDMKRINIAEGDDVPIDDDGSNDGVDCKSTETAPEVD